MIDSRELRIGNWITDSTGKPFKLSPHMLYNIAVDGELANIAQPIPLSPDILEKCGYKYREHLRDFYFKPQGTGTIFIVSLVHNTFAICASNEKPCLYVNLEALHTLQNLHSSLLKTELNITL